MNNVALSVTNMSAEELGMQYALSLQKRAMTDIEQQVMGELAMLPPAPGIGEYIDTYA